MTISRPAGNTESRASPCSARIAEVSLSAEMGAKGILRLSPRRGSRLASSISCETVNRPLPTKRGGSRRTAATYSPSKFSPPMPGGTLPKSPEGMARETLRSSKPVVVSQYVDGLRWIHASPRDESLIPAVSRFRLDLSRGDDALWFCNESLRRRRSSEIRLSISTSPNQSQRVPPLFINTCWSLLP